MALFRMKPSFSGLVERKRGSAVIRPPGHARSRRRNGLGRFGGKLHDRHPAQSRFFEENVEQFLPEPLFFPRRVDKSRVETSLPFPPKVPKLGPCIPAPDVKALGKPHPGGFFANVAAEPSVFLQRDDSIRPAAECFKGYRTAPRAYIKKVPAIQPLTENIEKGLPDPIARGTDGSARRRAQPPSPGMATNDSKGQNS